MNRPRKQLLSWPFVMLYISAIGAVMLHFTAPQLGNAAWFPLAAGTVGALAVYPLRYLLAKTLTRAARERRKRVLLFLFVPALTTVSIVFMTRQEIVLICTLILMSLVFLAAAIATAFNLPPLQTGRVEGRCPKCRCKLDHWPGKQCPECRWHLAMDAPDSSSEVEFFHIG